jgi:2-polyprenyl-3-methyl-5-hydroxy-6-metoxy-1,4-benzoquinol methylase
VTSIPPPNVSTAEVAWPDSALEWLEACPVCGDRRRALLDDRLVDIRRVPSRDWALYACQGCGTGYLDPRPTLETVHLLYEGAYYTHEPPPPPDFWPTSRGAVLRERLLKGYVNARFGYNLRPHFRVGAWLVPLIPGARGMGSNHVRHLPAPAPGSRLLDVGCGNGGLLVRMKAAGWEVEGLEPDPDAAERARAAGLDVRHGSVSADAFPAERFDAITMNHVIEHLHDPVAALRACFDWLKPGGMIWIATPNFGAAGFRRYGRYWVPLGPPIHLVLFTRRSLDQALRQAGFASIERPPMTLLATRWTYRWSRAHSLGQDPNHAPALPWREVARAVAADIRALARPDVGEELTLVGHKPA